MARGVAAESAGGGQHPREHRGGRNRNSKPKNDEMADAQNVSLLIRPFCALTGNLIVESLGL